MKKPPNVILIIAEELRADFLGYMGNSDSETPFLDRLASESINFCNHFTVHGKCVPSRAALFSGRYPHCGGHRTLGIPLQENEISLAKLLKENGYQTILVLKNHTIKKEILAEHFDEHWQDGVNGKKSVSVKDYTPETSSHDRRPGNKYADNYMFGKINVAEEDTCDYLATERVVDFIQHRQADDKSFFLDLNFHYTHTPYEIMEPYYSRFMAEDLNLLPDKPGAKQPAFMHKLYELHGANRLDEADRKEMLALYYGMLNFLDNRVQEIYQALEVTGELDNTIFIFTADHGDFVGQYGLPEKWDTIFSDCLLHVPLLIRVPEKFKPYATEALTETIDILPTLLELLELEAPYGIQGQSLTPLMRGDTDTHKDYVFAEGGHEKELLDIAIEPDAGRLLIVGYLIKAQLREVMPESLRKAKMIRTSTHKLIFRVCDCNELYDLREDPWELNNVYEDNAYRAVREELEKTLLLHLIETEENLPFDPVPIS